MSKISRNLTFTAVGCSVAFLAVGLVMNVLWRRSLFYDGIQAIRAYQQEAEQPVFTYIHNLLSKLYGSGVFKIVIAAVYLGGFRKIPVLSFIIYFYSKNYLVYTAKMAFMDPRPFWSSTTVKQLEWGCPDQYGNPSGHSSSTLLFAILIYDVVLRRDKPVLFLLAALIGLTVPISRLYLGAHSSNQVLLGMLIQLCLFTIYRYKLQEVIYNWLNNLLSRKTLSQMVWIAAAYALALFVPYVVYQLRISNPTSQDLINNMLIGCPHSKTKTGLQMLTKTFEGCGFIGVMFGVLMALRLSQRENYRYLYGQWDYVNRGICSILARVLIEAAPAYAAQWLFASYIPKHIANAYLRYLSTTFGLFLFGFLPVMYSRRLLLNSEVIYQKKVHFPTFVPPGAICCC